MPATAPSGGFVLSRKKSGLGPLGILHFLGFLAVLGSG